VRNQFEYHGWILEKVRDLTLLENFDCGDSDLNEYYHWDVRAHQYELLTQTYRFYPVGASEEFRDFALVDFCNDAVRVNKIGETLQEQIPEGKRHYSFLPAVKIIRLGIEKDSQGSGIGSLLLTAVKYFFLEDNRTGCRFITVDAYNHPDVTRFYVKNQFEFLEMRESQRKGRLQLPMVFDLRNLI